MKTERDVGRQLHVLNHESGRDGGLEHKLIQHASC
jgi:hypothetical protein